MPISNTGPIVPSTRALALQMREEGALNKKYDVTVIRLASKNPDFDKAVKRIALEVQYFVEVLKGFNVPQAEHDVIITSKQQLEPEAPKNIVYLNVEDVEEESQIAQPRPGEVRYLPQTQTVVQLNQQGQVVETAASAHLVKAASKVIAVANTVFQAQVVQAPVQGVEMKDTVNKTVQVRRVTAVDLNESTAAKDKAKAALKKEAINGGAAAPTVRKDRSETKRLEEKSKKEHEKRLEILRADKADDVVQSQNKKPKPKK